MKKTQRKDAVRNIRRRIVSYLSICLVIMLGLGGVFTTRYMNAGLMKQAAAYYDAHSGSVSFGGKKENVIVISLTERVSVPDVAEGKLPEGTDECMIGEDFAEEEGIKVGDRLRISLTALSSLNSRDGDTEKKVPMLLSKEFTVTGLMHHPDYLRRKSDNTVSIPLSAFNTEATDGLYTRAFVITEQPEKTNMLEEKYFDEMEETRLSLEELAEELEEDRTNEVKAQAHAYIDEEWEKTEAELADAQAEIDAGQADLNAELAAGRKQLSDAQNKLDRETAKYEKLFSDGEKELSEKEKELNKGKKLLAENKKELDAARSKIRKGRKELREKEKQLEEGKEYFEIGTAMIDLIKEKLGGDENIDHIKETATEIRRKTEEIDKLIKEGAEEQQIEEKVKDLGEYIVEHKDEIKKVFDLAADPETGAALASMEEYVDADLTKVRKAFDLINDYGYDNFIDDAAAMKDTGDVEYYNKMRETLVTTADAMIELVDALRDLEETLAEKEKEISDAEEKLAEAGEELKGYEKDLKKGEKEYAKYENRIKKAEKRKPRISLMRRKRSCVTERRSSLPKRQRAKERYRTAGTSTTIRSSDMKRSWRKPLRSLQRTGRWQRKSWQKPEPKRTA